MSLLVGNKVIIRSITRDDLMPLWRMIYGEESPEWKKWDAPYYPLERADYEQFMEQMKDRLASDEDVPSRMAITTKTGELIGMVTYYWEIGRFWGGCIETK